ncbi:PAAR domain-containing protein [Roseibium sp.]|uniref:PAAR domain-containing protein n=1 Tax=Roseibium sp. TaxID=1936156 RepID=UPI003263771F
MRFPAARLSDMHTCPMCMGVPAPIVWKCAYTVLTGKMPQARVGDMCVCVGPPPPAGGDPIITGAWNVLVEGSPAARMTDLTAKGGAIITGFPTVLIGMQGAGGGGGGAAPVGLLDLLKNLLSEFLSAVFAAQRQVYKDGFDVALAESADKLSKFLFAEGSLEIEREGLIGRLMAKFDTGLAKWDVSGHFFEAFPYIGGYTKGDVLRLQAKDELGVVYGGGHTLGVKATGATAGAGFFIGDDENNPWYEAGVQGAAGQAELAGEALVGYDGRRAGIAVGGKAAADGLAGDVVNEVNIPIPFTDYSIGMRGKVGVTGYSAGAEGRGYGFYDTETDRAHTGLSGGIDAGAGLGGSIDFSIGKRYKDRNRDSAGF